MKKLKIASVKDLDEIFKVESIEMITNIRDSIEEALRSNKRVAQIFEISMEDFDSTFQIELSRKDWTTALNNCLEHYEKWEMGDHALDTYLLLKEVSV